MANINKIKLSGTTYNIQDLNAPKTVELTQAQYDALSTKDPNTFYVITDAQGADLSNYYTKSETSGATEISTALASKQTTLTAGTGIDITDNVISATGGGGGVTVDPSLDSGSTNPVANSAITTAINSCAHIPVAVFNYKGYLTKIAAGGEGSNNFSISYTLTEYDGITKSDNNFSFNLYPSFINGKRCVSPNLSNVGSFNLVETSAITTSVSSLSTDTQVPSAKAVYDQLGGMKIVKLTESEYTALVTKDSNTLYVVVPDPSN